MEDLKAEPGVTETLVSAQSPPWLLLGDVLLCTSTHPFFAGWGPLQGHVTSLYIQETIQVLRPCFLSRKQQYLTQKHLLASLAPSASTNVLFTSQSGKNTLMGVTSEDYQLPGSTRLPNTWGSTGGKVAKPAYASSQLYRNHFFGRWDWDTPSSNHQSHFLSRIHVYLSQFKKQISDAGLHHADRKSCSSAWFSLLFRNKHYCL